MIVADPFQQALEESPGPDNFVEADSGLLVPAHVEWERVREERRMTAVDLFAGCGGMSLGMIQAGMNVVAMVEWDTTAAITYSTNLCRWGEMQFHFLTPEDEARMEKALQKEFKNFGPGFDGCTPFIAGSGWIQGEDRKVPGVAHVIIGDIALLTGKQLLEWIGLGVGELGCIAGSPPCQGFSTANTKRDDDDPRNDLCFEMARLIVETMPLTMVLENVPQFAKSPKCARFMQILKQGGFHGVEAMERFCKQKPGRVSANINPSGLGHHAKKKKTKERTTMKSKANVPELSRHKKARAA